MGMIAGHILKVESITVDDRPVWVWEKSIWLKIHFGLSSRIEFLCMKMRLCVGRSCWEVNILQSHFYIMYTYTHIFTSRWCNYGEVRMDLPYFILYYSILIEVFTTHLGQFITLQWIKIHPTYFQSSWVDQFWTRSLRLQSYTNVHHRHFHDLWNTSGPCFLAYFLVVKIKQNMG